MPLATIYGETTPSIAYRDGFKYVLEEQYVDKVPIYPDKDIVTKWVCLSSHGELLLRAGFGFDGPSGPTIDTKSAMRGAATHDAIYRLLRLGLLDEKWRAVADHVYEDKCVEDGMWKIRAWAHFRALRRFGWTAAKKGTEPPTLTAP